MTREERAEVRRVNLRSLMQGFEYKKDFAAHVGISTAHLGMISSPLKRANIGDAAARKFEKAFSKPDGWMDIDQDTNDGLPFDVDLVLSAIDALDGALEEVGKSRLYMDDKTYKKMLRAIIVRSYNDNEITVVHAKDYLVAAHVAQVTY